LKKAIATALKWRSRRLRIFDDCCKFYYTLLIMDRFNLFSQKLRISEKISKFSCDKFKMELLPGIKYI